MQNADNLEEVRNILEGAERNRPWRSYKVLGGGGLALLIAAVIASAIIELGTENSRLKTSLASANGSPATTVLVAEKDRLLRRTHAIQAELKTVQRLATKQSEHTTRPISPQQVFVLEELTRNAAWLNGRRRDAMLATLLDHLGVARLADIKGNQWAVAISHLYEMRANSARRVYDPAAQSQ